MRPETDPRLRSVTLLSASAIAKLLDVNRRTIWRLVAAGTLPEPSIRINERIVRWRLPDIEAWMATLDGRPTASA